MCRKKHLFASPYTSVRAGHWCQQCAHFAAASASRKSKKFQHWQSGEQIVATGGFEQSFVRFFNRHRIPFVWQVFFPLDPSMEIGREFVIDVYLPEIDHFCEIKGTFRSERSYQKWLFFSTTFQNSSLLSRNELEALGILEPRANQDLIRRFHMHQFVKSEFYRKVRRISTQGKSEPSLMHETKQKKDVSAKMNRLIIERRNFLSA